MQDPGQTTAIRDDPPVARIATERDAAGAREFGIAWRQGCRYTPAFLHQNPRWGLAGPAFMAGAGGGDMLARRELTPILDDEALTRHLGDAEARVLVEWLVEQAEQLPPDTPLEQARLELARLCRRGRVLSRFVRLWCLEDLPGAATQLVAAERLDWPLPDGPIDPDRLMQQLVDWEGWKRRQVV